MAYAQNTTVAPERSRHEIERTLRRYGADAFSFAYDGTRQAVLFRAHGRMVRFDVALPPLEDFRWVRGGRTYGGGAGERERDVAQMRAAREKHERQRWRALALVVKAKLESIEAGIESFEEAFMAHVVLPDGTRFGDWAAPQIADVYATGQMPALLPSQRALDRTTGG